MKLSGLTREAVLQAVQEIDITKLAKNQLSSDYQVLIGDQYYPFKMLVEKSYKIATGVALPSDTFKEYFYLSKQFTEFSGFKVRIAGAVILNKYVREELHLLIHDEYLVHSMEDTEMDLSVLGPSFNDDNIQKRKFRDLPGFNDIKPGNLFYLVTQEVLYGLVQVVADESVERPKLPIRVMFLTPPLKHGMDLSEERYPLLHPDFYAIDVRPLARLVDQYDPSLLEKTVELIRSK